MNTKKFSGIQFFTYLLLALLLMQFPFVNQVFCIESDGQIAIETVQLGRCDTLPSTADGHEDSCKNCTDIPLDQDIMSRLDSDQDSLKILNPSYVNLYAGDYKLYGCFPSTEKSPVTFTLATFVYHPSQSLQSIILII
jgi:hypothetical protein